MALFDEMFGYSNSLLASTGIKKERTLCPAYVTRGVLVEFSQRIHAELWRGDNMSLIKDDAFVLSKCADDPHAASLRKLLRQYGYTDFLLQYVKNDKTKDYIYYFMWFSTDREYNEDDMQIAKCLGDVISVSRYPLGRTIQLQSQNNMLIGCMNHFPVGVILVNNLHEVVYTNKIAEVYLKDLGVIDSRFYSTFYYNNIYPHYQYDMLNFAYSRPMRLGNYVFNVTITSSPAVTMTADILSVDSQKALSPEGTKDLFSNISSCIYIIRDDRDYPVFSDAAFASIGLTKREREVAECIIQGLSSNEIAKHLGNSTNTIRVHVSNILRKANVTNRIELINKLIQAEGVNQ